jgi:hypothetical protein
VATTAETMMRIILDSQLQSWPGGTLVSEALATLVAPSIVRAHELAQLTLRTSVPFDTLLATAVGIGKSGVTGDALARIAAGRFISIINAATTPISVSPVPTIAAALPSFPPPFGGSGFNPPQNWTLTDVMGALFRLGSIAALDLVELPLKHQLARTITNIAAAVPGMRTAPGSGASRAGGRVHAELQQRYLGTYGKTNLAIADRRVWGGFPARYVGQRLSDVYGSNPQLSYIYTAWLDPNYGGKRQWASGFRGDITDLGRMTQWEIKPFSDAQIGVLQETWYRVSYNYVADVWVREHPPLQGRLGTLQPGGMWEPSLCWPSIDVTMSMGYAALAVPITVPLFTGLVLYTVFSGPQLCDVAALTLLLYNWLPSGDTAAQGAARGAC